MLTEPPFLRVLPPHCKEMGHGVHIQVTIPSSVPEALFRLAESSLLEKWAEPLFDSESKTPPIPGSTEGYEFLVDLRNKNAFHKWGNEGGVIIWGMVGNHSAPGAFVELLRPFWTAVFTADPKIIDHAWQKILIVHSDSGGIRKSGIIEIGWDDDEAKDRAIVFRVPGSEPFSCI